jgi:hypothetical protein
VGVQAALNVSLGDLLVAATTKNSVSISSRAERTPGGTLLKLRFHETGR